MTVHPYKKSRLWNRELFLDKATQDGLFSRRPTLCWHNLDSPVLVDQELPHGPTLAPVGLGGPPRRAPECQSASVRARAERQGYRAMPYFKTSTEWFEQSSLLLKARPASVRHNASSVPFQRHLITPTDPHHLQVLGTHAYTLQDLQAPEVRRKTGGQACHDYALHLPPASPEARRADRDLHPQNVRCCLGHMSAV